MTITVSVPDHLGAHAAARGLSVEAYVESVAAEAAKAALPEHQQEQRRGVEGLLAFRRTHSLTLARDLTVGVRSWVHQEHKH